MQHLLQGLYDVDAFGHQFILEFRLQMLRSEPSVKEQFFIRTWLTVQ